MEYTEFSILEAVPYAVIITDEQGMSLWQNEQAQKSNLAVQIGKSIEATFADKYNITEAIGQAAKTESSVRINMENTRTMDMKISSGSVFISKYNQYVMLTIFEDSMFMSGGVHDSLHRFVVMLAHEIKNPLSGIRGISQLLDTGEQGCLASLITQETDRISKLVNDLENLSELRNVVFGSVNIHEVLDSVITLSETGFASTCEIIKQYDPSLPNVWGDKDRLSQVFINLIKNSAEAMDTCETRKITVRTSYLQGVSLSVQGGQHRAICVDITDTGMGIPETQKDNIFAPYITDKTGGKGLGLSIVSSIISSHGGRITYKTSVKGTTFSIIVPMEKST